MVRVISPLRALATLAALASAAGAAEFPSRPIALVVAGVEFPSVSLSFFSRPIETETARTIEVTLPADILFDFDKATLRPAAEQALHEVARLIREKARGPVSIHGHTDALGTDAYNRTLSERRAGAVKAWLVARAALVANRLSTKGFGARNPVAPNRRPDGSDDPDGRQQNRRVTLVLSK